MPRSHRFVGRLTAVGLALALLNLGMSARSVVAAGAELLVGVGDAAVVEGTVGNRTMTFAVTLNRPSTAPVTVQYRVAGVDAVASTDFTASSALRTAKFSVGGNGSTPVTKYVTVAVRPDAIVESTERLTVTLSNPSGVGLGRAIGTGSIVDDDPIGNGFRASVGDASIVEGDQGSRALKFTVSLSQAAPATVSMTYSVQPLSASSGSDVTVGASRVLTFTRGASGLTPVAKVISVPVAADSVSEGTETFALVLSNPSVGVLLSRPTGIGTIIDDEPTRRPLMGTAVRWPTLLTDTPYAAIAGRRFDAITPENEMKWDLVQPQRGTFNFASADGIVKFARDHGEDVHGHALVWHAQNPAWLTNGSFSRAELIDILTTHISTVVAHYRGQVAWWDVANEVIDDAGQLRSSVWSQGIGPEFVDIAFAAARAADPSARLFINDYSIDGPGAKSDALYALVAGLVARGVPIDGVGFQAHATPGWVTEAQLGAEFARYRALGLDVAVTELDVRVPTPASPAALAAQAATYRMVLDACRNAPNCVSFTTWGFTDRYSWIPSWFPGVGDALPWDSALGTKPAYAEIASALRN